MMRRKLILLGSIVGLIGIILGQIANTWSSFLYAFIGSETDLIDFSLSLGLVVSITSTTILQLANISGRKPNINTLFVFLSILVLTSYVAVFSFSYAVYEGSMPIFSPYFLELNPFTVALHSIGILVFFISLLFKLEEEGPFE